MQLAQLGRILMTIYPANQDYFGLEDRINCAYKYIHPFMFI